MTLRELKSSSKICASDFQEIMIFLNGWTNQMIINNQEEILDKKTIKAFFAIVKKQKNKPLSYILKNKYFYKNQFYVDKRVLIPRRETELIVEEIISDSLTYKSYADICTGSGCIGLSIAKYKKIEKLYLSDISKKALRVCEINQKILKVQAELILGDFLEPFLKRKIKLNLLTINPPYIKKNCPYLDDLVYKNEPKKALFSKKEGLFFYDQLFKNIEEIMDLKNKFKIICEFGFNQKNEIKEIFKLYGLKYNMEFKKDLSNNDRYFIITN